MESQEMRVFSRWGIFAPSSRVWVLLLCGAVINNSVAVVL